MTDPRPVLNQLNLVVRDMDATVRFYRRLGVAIAEDAVWRTPSGGHHLEVEMPNGMTLDFDSVALAKRYNAGWRAPGGGGCQVVIGFAMPSRDAVDARYAELTAAGYAGRQPPGDAFWGARYAIIEDPDGNQVGLMSPIDPARRGTSPDL
jgi:catechol 2,3-dioxygenase-like lactoylglutathione lyase family enzyme